MKAKNDAQFKSVDEFSNWFMANYQMPCMFIKEHICTNKFDCTNCGYAPEDDEKENGLKEPVFLKWEDDFPVCPSCGEMPYDTKRCFFCGQKFIENNNGKENETW